MKSLIRLMVLAGALIALPAQAMVITDIDNPYKYLGEGDSYTVTHDLTDDGVPLDYLVTAASLRLSFSDGFLVDLFDVVFDKPKDWAAVSGDGLAGTFEVDGTHVFGYDVKWLSVGGAGIDALNAVGKLAVTVTAISMRKGYNDFWWKESMLKAHVEPVGVPEPGTLGLLGLGLVAVGLARRRRLAA